MKAHSASFTAQMMALYRAMETRKPDKRASQGRANGPAGGDGRASQGRADGPAGGDGRASQRRANGPAGGDGRLFTDPYASCFLKGRLRLAAWLAGFSAGERWLYRYMQRRIPGALGSGIARTRYIDDLLEQSLGCGVKQVILLGAGFDTRALRLAAMRRVHVLEIDHPDTAGRKQALLRKAVINLPANVRYLSVDLNQMSPGELFRRQGIRITQPTVVIWEGVTNYLEREAVDAVMRLVGSFPQGSAIIFTYIHRRVLEEPAAWFGAERLIADLERIQEKWTCGFLPEEMPGYLAGFGLQLVEDRGAAEYRTMYMPERAVLLKGYEFYRVAVAKRLR